MARMSGVFDWLNPKKKTPSPQAPPQPHIDLYHFFGVDSSATQGEIRAAYRDLASKFHPDRNPGDPVAARRFQEIVSAYQILSDEKKRSAYDAAYGSPGKASTSLPVIVPEAPSTPASGSVPRDVPGTAPRDKGASAPKASSFWGSMFSPSPSAAPAEVFRGFEAERPEPRVERHPVGTAGGADIYAILGEWPLEAIFDLVRADRQTPWFRDGGAMVVDTVAGQSGSASLDLAELFGIPYHDAAAFVRQHGADAFLSEIAPMFEDLTRAMDRLKPRDLPGKFFLDWDPGGRLVELVYSERSR